MWGLVLIVNGILLSLSGVYLIYSIGAAILMGEWKQLLIALLICIFFSFAEVAIAAIAEP